jgi:hypothetical protein
MDYIFAVIGFALGYAISKNTTTVVESDMSKQQRLDFEDKIAYYKKLCKTLADENAEFRRKQK